MTMVPVAAPLITHTRKKRMDDLGGHFYTYSASGGGLPSREEASVTCCGCHTIHSLLPTYEDDANHDLGELQRARTMLS